MNVECETPKCISLHYSVFVINLQTDVTLSLSKGDVRKGPVHVLSMVNRPLRSCFESLTTLF